jgi:hypothetical protein
MCCAIYITQIGALLDRFPLIVGDIVPLFRKALHRQDAQGEGYLGYEGQQFPIAHSSDAS